METISQTQPINLKVVRFELDFSKLMEPPKQEKKKAKKIRVPQIHNVERRPSNIPAPPVLNTVNTKKDVKQLIEELLEDLYSDPREWSSSTGTDYRGSISAASVDSSMTIYDHQNSLHQLYLEDLDENIIKEHLCEMDDQVLVLGQRLGRCVRTRDRLRRQQKRLCAAVSVLLRRLTGDHNARFGLAPSAGTEPGCGEGGFAEWLHAMRLVARLPAGVPQHFRKKLWVSLAERHFLARGVDWPAAERACFRGTAQPDDTELGAQILKDLHRTGCSLFCGAEGRENQAMLRRVLLAYARWNKDVGYCQGFNMLAAIILEVMDKSESDSLKVMIYLVEAVLPEGYFADDLRGLSADMAAFRDLLKLRLPRLANHMDHLQKISDGGGVEPPLPDVFTMQWFLTLYATWLPRDALLRIWDLVLLDGNEVLLLTALAIWDLLQDRILSARSADEYYSCMGGGAGAVWEASEALVAKVVSLGSAPELPRLRSAHRYRVAPPQAAQPLHSAMQSMTRRGLRLFYSEDEGDSSDDGNKMALATVMIPRREEQAIAGERLSLDIGALKRQYARLRERQRQAHVILAAACARHAAVGIPTSPTSLTVNNLLLGKSAIVSNRGRRLGPPPGAIPPSRSSSEKHDQRTRIPGSETISWNEEKSRKTLSRRNSLKWKDVKKQKAVERIRKTSIDLDEAGDGIIVSEREANEMIASVRSRSSSETSSYSSRSETSSDTSLCDDNAKDSDSEPELPADKEKNEEKVVPENEETPCKVDVEPSKSTSPIYKNNVDEHSSSTLDINKYIETPAGEPLRTYIGGFESKLQESVMKSTDNKDVYRFLDLRDKSLSPPVNKSSADFPELANIDLMGDLQRMAENNNVKYTQKSPRAYAKHSTNVTELSPIELSPCNHKFISPLEYTFSSQQNITPKPELLGRESPDIIRFSKNPIVTDIDLSDKNMSDIDSPPRSPGAESIIVSEDEPPIPLKIDKYFEHSPEFFGARYTITDSQNSDFSSRRPPKRHFRIPKKPDSLTLHCNNNDKLKVEEEERASSLPQSLKFSPTTHKSPECRWSPKPDESFYIAESIDLQVSPKENISSPLKDIKQEITKNNSERALQIIQENSKILSRILTKHQNNIKSVQENTNGKIPSTTTAPELAEADTMTVSLGGTIPDATTLKNISPLESLVRYRKKLENKDFNDFIRTRPISIDDPISLGKSMSLLDKVKLSTDNKSPSSECLANKTDLYGWENKGFQAKSDYASFLTKPEDTNQNNKSKTPDFSAAMPLSETKEISTSDWRNYSLSGQRKSDNNTSTPKDFKLSSPYDRKADSNDSCYQFSNKYNNTSVTKVNDLGNRTIGQGREYENIHKTDDSQATDFAHIVTSSISFTYEESAEDDSPFGAKSNSSDTLCQITSLDQVSTPISPKIFPKEHTGFPRDLTDKSDRVKLESDDTCSTITSLVETDTLSSLSYPRSPSTGSYHHFPTRPSMRMPKEIGIRLGMYPKDSISSPQK